MWVAALATFHGATCRFMTCGLYQEMRKSFLKPVTLFRAERENFVAGGLQAEMTTLLEKICPVERDCRKACAFLRSRLTEDA